MHESTAPIPEQSYFHEQQAIRARKDEVAAPFKIDGLLAILDYLSEPELELIRQAYEWAANAHAGQSRQTGHPYITHPLAVTGILANMKADAHCIMAALLHDVLEDTAVDKETLAAVFGPEVVEIVKGVSKLSNLDKSDIETKQAENFRSLISTAAADIRVIIVKLADRLHNMQTLGVMPLAKRRRIAEETMDIYAPIADRLGIHTLKNNLEDLAFATLYPVRADHIEDAIQRFRARSEALMPTIHSELEEKLRNDSIPVKILVHKRHLYSIYKEMKLEKKRFRDIEKVYAFDLLVDDELNCYKALGSVHTLFRPNVESFKDHIAIPKRNGYRSLHTSIFTPDNIPIKLFIRTEKMHVMAQQGALAEHYLGGLGKTTQFPDRYRGYLREVLDLQELSDDSKEFLANFKHDHSSRDLIVYTPRNESIELPRGASVLDFAYAIHTDIGNTATGCTIDEEVGTLAAILESGQTVEIRTDPNGQPSPSWLYHVKTAKAKAAIRQTLNRLDRDTMIAIGQTLFKNKLAQIGYELAAIPVSQLEQSCEDLRIKTVEDLYARLGAGLITPATVVRYLNANSTLELSPVALETDGAFVLQGVEGPTIVYGDCCGPVPGDAVLAQHNADKGWVIHLRECKSGEKQRADQTEVMPVRWSEDVTGKFETTLKLVVISPKTEIVDIVNALNSVEADIEAIDTSTHSGREVSVVVRLLVHDLNHLKEISNVLKHKPYVQSVSRPEGEEITWQDMPSTPQMHLKQ